MNVITPDDLRILIEFEDEVARCGNFTCLFPTVDSNKYMKFFESTRYYNVLLIEWILKYGNCREKGKWTKSLHDSFIFFVKLLFKWVGDRKASYWK